jgi:hypothetical protein
MKSHKNSEFQNQYAHFQEQHHRSLYKIWRAHLAEGDRGQGAGENMIFFGRTPPKMQEKYGGVRMSWWLTIEQMSGRIERDRINK